MKHLLEYVWMDGTEPTKLLRSKIRVVDLDRDEIFGDPLTLDDIPEWGFDGSSTNQAEGNFSDCKLVPVRVYNQRFGSDARFGETTIVLCEVYNPDGTPHLTNTRRKLADLEDVWGEDGEDILVGLEQEYTFFEGNRPLGWPEGGYPPPQGPFYCGVGADEVFGRDLVLRHLTTCLGCDISVSGINAEVMPGQWEFQVGAGDPLKMSDDLIVARYLLFRLGEIYGVNISLDPKPVRGDWNGAGCHINFSTKTMREDGGLAEIEAFAESLRDRHDEHIAVYGVGNEARLTGRHETCNIHEFRWGPSDRGASIRIPADVVTNGKGYLEDRRPAANCDPYEACRALVEATTI